MITNKDYKFQKFGRKLLKLSTHPKYRMSCLMVKGGNIISVGINKVGSPPPYVKRLHKNMGLHCEVDCLAGISKKASRGATIYIFGETVKGNNILTQPCFSCYSFIVLSQIKRIVFENRDGSLEELKL